MGPTWGPPGACQPQMGPMNFAIRASPQYDYNWCMWVFVIYSFPIPLSRVSLDLMSVQANTGPAWENKTDKAIWRGRDSRQERLDLVVMSRKNPDLIDAKLTNMFFFKKDPDKYGELVKHISFFEFFKVRWYSECKSYKCLGLCCSYIIPVKENDQLCT